MPVWLSCFSRIGFGFLFSFYFQSKETQLKGCTKPLFLPCLSSILSPSYWHVLFVPTFCSLGSILEDLVTNVSIFHYILSACTALPQHSLSLKLGCFPFSAHLYPSCANLYMRPVKAEPQSSLRIPVSGKDVQTGVTQLPVMTGQF